MADRPADIKDGRQQCTFVRQEHDYNIFVREDGQFVARPINEAIAKLTRAPSLKRLLDKLKREVVVNIFTADSIGGAKQGTLRIMANVVTVNGEVRQSLSDCFVRDQQLMAAYDKLLEKKRKAYADYREVSDKVEAQLARLLKDRGHPVTPEFVAEIWKRKDES